MERRARWVLGVLLLAASCGDGERRHGFGEAGPPGPADAAPDARPLGDPDAAPGDAAAPDGAVACALDGVPCDGGAGVCCGGACVVGQCCTAAECTGRAGQACGADHACVDVAGNLDGLLWVLPCDPGASGTSCATSPTVSASTSVAGAPGVTYDVAVRVRGVVERKTYAASCGTGTWAVGGQPQADPYNLYALSVSSPAQTIYLNAGTSYVPYVFAVDVVAHLRVDAGATVSLRADAIDGAELRNLDQTGAPLSVPGTLVAQPYDGQFLQLDVLSVTPEPAPPGGPAGSPGDALRFDGGQWATIPAAIDLAPASFTAEAWVQAGALGGPYATIVGRTVGDAWYDTFTLWSQGGALRAGVTGPGGFVEGDLPWAPVADAWHHVAETYDAAAGVATLYLDGLPALCFAAAGPLAYDAHDVLVGGDVEYGAPNGFWTGAIDEVRLFDHARSADQVWADRRAHRLGPTPGLLGEWTFDEGVGQTAADSSGLGHDAVLGAGAATEAADPAWVPSTRP